MTKNIKLENQFSSAHFYHQPQWSPEKNKEIFGRCFTQFGHGHNYRLVSEWNNIAEIDIKNLKQRLQEIVQVLDHEHLNLNLDLFKDQIPTTEVILTYIMNQIEKKIDHAWIRLQLFEADDIGAEIQNP